MVTVNILYNTTTGRILSANLGAIAPVPAGHALLAKELEGISRTFDMKIEFPTLNLVAKDYVKVDSAVEVPVSNVVTVVVTKRNGETDELMDDPTDNELLQISARKDDMSFDEASRKAFFNRLTSQMTNGAGDLRVATGVAPGRETIVFFHDTLKPAFQVFTYV